MKNIIIGFGLTFITLNLAAQTPTASFSINNTSISEAGGISTLNATLSAPTSQSVTISLKPAGNATYQVDYETNFVGKGEATTVAGGRSAANQLRNPRSIYVDSNGNIFVADAFNHRIQKWTSGASQGITVAGGNGRGSAANQLNSPNSIFVDGAGNIFVSDWGNHRIQKWTPEATQGTTVAGGNGAGSAANQLNSPSGVYVYSNGNIFVADANNNRIQKWTPEAIQGTTVAGGNGAGSAANQLSSPYGVYVNSIGNIFVADRGNHRIQKWMSGTATQGITVAGGNGRGSAANQLNSPSGVYVYSNGNIFVADANNNRIQKWIPEATQGTTVAGGNSAGSAANQLNSPYGLYVISNGSIFVADENNNRIQKWTLGATQGTTVAGGNYPSAANQLNSPRSVYVDRVGNIFVADRDNHRIQKWTSGASQGITVAGGNGQGSAANQLNYPSSVYVDSDGNIFVADENNSRIQKWTSGASQGTTVAGGNGYGSAANQLSSPYGVYVNSIGNIFVTDGGNHRIQKWTSGVSQGITVAGGNGQGSAANQLNYPSGVYVDSNGNIFVADANNNRIQKWMSGTATQGITVAGGNDAGSAANQLNYPSGVYVDSNGNIFVADAGNNRIQKWIPEASQGTTVAGGNDAGSAASQLSFPVGVFIDSYGSIFVADRDNHSIQKVQNQPQIVIPAGQLSGICTIKGIEDLENESDETILLTAESVSNANLSTNSISIVLKDNQISLTKQLTSPVPSLRDAALSWGDYDQDGDQDLAILGYNDAEGAVTRVYRNQSGTLVKTEQNLMQFLSGDIKWMDINKDGYLDLMVSGLTVIDEDNSAPKTLLYLSNAGQSFSLVANLTIEHLYSSKMALGDLDNDGDSDLAIMGRNINNQTVFQVYKKANTQNTFTKITNFYPSIVGTDNDWDLKIADFDLDGDNDILYNGGYVRNNYVQSSNLEFSLNYTGLRYEVCKLFNDDSPLTILGIGIKNNAPIIGINQSVDFIDGTPTLKDGDIAVGDYNNDGLNDILLTGRNAVNTPQAVIYYQRSDKKFAKVPNISLDGLYNSTADWVDYDVDGDLDLIMTGLDANSIQQTFFYKSDTGVKKNTAPSMPSNLRVIDKGNGFVELKWDASTDDYSSFFGYNIRLGTTPGGSELSNTMSNLQTGSRLLTVTPPLFINSYTTQLSPGRYYWTVQGIDQGYQGSTFATEQIFDLKYEWKLLNQIDIVDRSVSPMSNPKFALLDIDNDNDLDLIYGSFTDRKVYLYQEKEYKLVSKNIGNGGVENIIAGDVNNDGKIDLVINGIDKQLGIYLNTGGDFSEVYRLTNNGLLQTKLKIIDINNNGLKEVMFTGMTSDLQIGLPKFYSLEWSGLDDTFNFLDESSKIATLKNAAYDFGDFDKDSRLDFILSGSGNSGTRTILYKNATLPGDPMSVSATVDVLPKITKGTIDFMDYDADGDEDLIFTGSTTAGDVFQLYDNQLANNVSSFVAREINMDAIQESNLNFGDFNGDGYTDIFYSGMKTGTGKITRLSQYNSLTKNYENSTFEYGNLTDTEVAFGDVDADGDLDMVLGGNDALNVNNKILRILLNVRNESAAVGKQAIKASNPLADRNVAAINTLSAFGVTNVLNANKAPNPPNLNSVRIVTESTKKLLSFNWNAATDDNTPSTGLTYSLRIGTAADTDNLLSTNADKSGVLKVPNVGNVVGNLNWKIKMLPDGVYYWSVQSVDASFVGSAFSAAQQFTIQNGDLLTVPAQPEAFTNGNNKPCKAKSEVYTVPAVSGVTTYRWTYSGEGATITGTGNSVNVAFSSTFTTGTLSVEAMNAYGASPKRSIDIIVGTTPVQPGAFTMSSPVVCQGFSKTYSIASVADASGYLWSYSGTGASITGSTTSVSLTYGTSATSGILSVKSVGACGNSAERTMNVTVIPQQKVINGVIANGIRHIHQASKSILLNPTTSTPIIMNAGTVFLAEIVGCSN